jgi:hypothetical protein
VNHQRCVASVVSNLTSRFQAFPAVSMDNKKWPPAWRPFLVRWTFASSANFSCDTPRRSRSRRTVRPNVRRENLVAFGTPHFYCRADDQSTDDPLQRKCTKRWVQSRRINAPQGSSRIYVHRVDISSRNYLVAVAKSAGPSSKRLLRTNFRYANSSKRKP